MTLPNDSIAITPGSGAIVACHVIEGKKHQVLIPAGPMGHLVDSPATWTAWADSVVIATITNTSHISILNAVGTGRLIQLQKLFAINLCVTAFVGSMIRFDVHRITAHSNGTLITPESLDSWNASLPGGITIRTGATVTEGTKLFGFPASSDEVGITGTIIAATHFLGGLNLLFESPRLQELTLREGQGIHVKQVTAGTAAGGLYGWILVFAVKEI